AVMIDTSTICIIYLFFLSLYPHYPFCFLLRCLKSVVISLISTFSTSAKLPFVVTRFQIGTHSLQFHMLVNQPPALSNILPFLSRETKTIQYFQEVISNLYYFITF